MLSLALANRTCVEITGRFFQNAEAWSTSQKAHRKCDLRPPPLPHPRSPHSATPFFVAEWLNGQSTLRAASFYLLSFGGKSDKRQPNHKTKMSRLLKLWKNPAPVFVARGNGSLHRDLLTLLKSGGLSANCGFTKILDLRSPNSLFPFPLSTGQLPVPQATGKRINLVS